MFHRIVGGWIATGVHGTNQKLPRRGLTLERLEEREVPAVTLATIGNLEIPNNKPIYIPVTVTNTPAGVVG